MRTFIARQVSVVTMLCITASSVFLATPHGAQALDEYDVMRATWQETLTGGQTYDPSDADIAPRIASITAEAQSHWSTMNVSPGRTYLWSDIASNTERNINTNYSRLKTMALAFATKGSSLESNETLRADILGALDWLHQNRYNEGTNASGNWWEWEIGIPLSLNDIVVLMYDHLSASQITNYMNAVDHFSPTVTLTGANRVDKAKVVGVRGVIVKNSSKIAAARDGLSPVFAYVTSGDGFYTDGSFIQHTRHPYSGSYGLVLITGIADLLYLLNGSTWQVTDPAVSNVFQWVHNSFEPLVYKGEMMDMVRGRAISRRKFQSHDAGHSLIRGIIRLSDIAPSNDAAAFKSMVKQWIQEDTFKSFFAASPINFIILAKGIMDDAAITPRGELISTKIYPSMDRAVHLRPGFGVGISMFSARTYNYESINSENLKGWHTSDGMTYLYAGDDLGQFSDEFWATVNPYRLPGTTVDTGTLADAAGQSSTSSKTWVGGAQLQNQFGAVGMDLDAYGSNLLAKKSWFLFDDEVVALGAGIGNKRAKNRTETIVENRKTDGLSDATLTVNGVQKPSTLGWSETMTATSWAHLNGVGGYFFPSGATVQGQREARTKSWYAINQLQETPASPTFTRTFLSLGIDHGIAPSSANYSYVLLPNRTASGTAAYASSPDVSIVSNTASVQAVKEIPHSILAANFWQAGTADFLSSSAPSSVLVREENGQIIVAVSNPQQSQSTFTVELQKTAASVLANDPTISIISVSPTIKFSVNTTGSRGKTHTATFALPE